MPAAPYGSGPADPRYGSDGLDDLGEASLSDPGGWAGPDDDPNGFASADAERLSYAHSRAREQAESGDLTGARTLLEEALATGELRFGRDHPRLAPLMVDLATIARNVGNLTEAQNQLRRAYGIVLGAAGPDDATALSIEGRLAAVSHRLGEPTEAHDWHIAEVGTRVLGADHPAVRGAQQRLGAMATGVPPPAAQGYDATEAAAFAGYVPSPYEPGVYHRLPADDGYVPEPSPRPYPPAEVWPETPAPARRGGRGGFALVAVVVLAILVAAAVIGVQLFGVAGQAANGPGPSTSSGPVSPSGSAGVRAPTGVHLKDDLGSVTLTWTDPSGGRVPFIIAGGRAGGQSSPLSSTPAGRTTSTIVGLNSHYDYCFTVAAVWSADDIAASTLTCTNRRLSGGGT